jgi:hypothetical protein
MQVEVVRVPIKEARRDEFGRGLGEVVDSMDAHYCALAELALPLIFGEGDFSEMGELLDSVRGEGIEVEKLLGVSDTLDVVGGRRLEGRVRTPREILLMSKAYNEREEGINPLRYTEEKDLVNGREVRGFLSLIFFSDR